MGTDYTADANCQAAYLFSEGSGTSVADDSQNNNTGTFAASGQPAWSSAVPNAFSDYSANFETSTSDDIKCGASEETRVNRSFTIVAWINQESNGADRTIMSHRGNCWCLRVGSDNKLHFLESYVADVGSSTTALSSTATWYHVAFTLGADATATGTFYKDGSSDGTLSTNRTFDDGTTILSIGSDGQNESAIITPFDGLITEVAFFDRVLSGTEINDIQDNGLKQATTSCALTGTITSSVTEADITTGGKTLILTVTGDTFVASGATFDAQRQNIINGIDSAQAEGTGWDAVVKAGLAVTDVVRTSDTVVTITLPAFATYDITSQETITATVPATALTGAAQLVASPTFTIDPVSTSTVRMLALTGVGQ